jgi:FMN phosphatase YigB (HAD superfamily)
MLRAVLFDLDGTLLDLQIDRFLREYFGLLGPVMARLSGLSPEQSVSAVMAATETMLAPHPNRANATVFADHFAELTSVDIRTPGAAAAVEEFYALSFPALGCDYGPAPGARTAYSAARASGARVAVATNPIFPLSAIGHRLSWAGFSADEFDLVTHYELMEACKPQPAYFGQVAELLEVDPEECLMVGDDAQLDLPAREIGMTTWYVGRDDEDADYRGTLAELAEALPDLLG